MSSLAAISALWSLLSANEPSVDRQLVARLVLAVEHRAEHVGVGRVAVLEGDDDLLAGHGEHREPALLARRRGRAPAPRTSPRRSSAGSCTLTRPSFSGSLLLVTMPTTIESTWPAALPPLPPPDWPSSVCSPAELENCGRRSRRRAEQVASPWRRGRCRRSRLPTPVILSFAPALMLRVAVAAALGGEVGVGELVEHRPGRCSSASPLVENDWPAISSMAPGNLLHDRPERLIPASVSCFGAGLGAHDLLLALEVEAADVDLLDLLDRGDARAEGVEVVGVARARPSPSSSGGPNLRRGLVRRRVNSKPIRLASRQTKSQSVSLCWRTKSSGPPLGSDVDARSRARRQICADDVRDRLVQERALLARAHHAVRPVVGAHDHRRRRRPGSRARR